MRGLSIKIARWIGGLIRPRPSLFDLCLAGYLVTPFIKDSTIQEIYFIFYIIFLVCISINLRSKKEYKSTLLMPLSLFSLWAFCGVFIHSFVICEESITMRYLNMYLLSEGFIYILFGVLFITLVIKYSKSIKLFYCLIPIVLFLTLKRPGDFNKTFILSTGLAILIYLLLSKRFWLASLVGIGGVIFAKLRWASLMVSWVCRPYVWKQLCKEIAKHPWVGSGWYHGLEHPNNMLWVEGQDWGWLWRHNDWLSLAAYLGIPALIFVLWFFIVSAKRIGIRPALIPLLTIGIMSFFQMNFFRIERAPIYLLTIGLCIRQGYKE